MIAALIAELRKLLTVRSTYVIFLFTLVILGLVHVYAIGMKASPMDLHNPFFVMNNAFDAVQNLMMLGSIVAILLMSHEYRYNTITYTLTASNSRSKVLLAKILAVSLYAVVFTGLLAVFGVLLLRLGVALGGHTLVAQSFYYQDFIWRALAFGWGTMMFALLFTALVRSQVAAIALFFLWPTLVESIAALVLHAKVAYLPFQALGTVISNQSVLQGFTSVRALLVVLATLVGGWAVAWVSFYRRDAN
jgi:ABC-type transport system involved in multi-copper enzyme maturation permease subunit